jgi:hypothetical protein
VGEDPDAPRGLRSFAVFTTEHLDISSGGHHDVSVRTTLTLEPDVAARLKQEARRTGKGLKSLVNEAWRASPGPHAGSR